MEFMAADQFKDDFLLPQIIFCYFTSFGILPIDILIHAIPINKFTLRKAGVSYINY